MSTKLKNQSFLAQKPKNQLKKNSQNCKTENPNAHLYWTVTNSSDSNKTKNKHSILFNPHHLKSIWVAFFSKP